MEGDFQTLLDREAIVETIVRLFVGTDQRDWKSVEACLTSEVWFDVRSLTAETPAQLPSRQIIEMWRLNLAPMREVHHQLGNFLIALKEDEADAFCYGTTFHYRPNPSGRNTRTMVGRYDLHLTKSYGLWRINAFTFHLKFVEGNLDLETL